MVAQSVASATFRVTCSGYNGSGFALLRPDILVTSFHAVRGGYHQAGAVLVTAEDGRQSGVEYLTHSPETEHDFALFRLKQSFEDAAYLRAGAADHPQRGLEVLLSGFPHGVTELLVQRAIVSGPCDGKGFYIDCPVNGGHAGGPVVDVATGEIVGILTGRRSLGIQDLDLMASEASNIARSCQRVASQGAVAIMGVDFAPFAKMVAQSNILLRRLIEASASAGLGVAYDITPVLEAYTRLGLH